MPQTGIGHRGAWGLALWHRFFTTPQARMTIRGAIFEAKHIARLQDDVTYEVQLHEGRVTVDRFGGPGRRLRFLPSRLTLKSFAGDIIAGRDDPRDAFEDHNADSAWEHCISAILPAARSGPI